MLALWTARASREASLNEDATFSPGAGPFDYYHDDSDPYMVAKSISRTAEIEREMLSKLITFTKGALSQAEPNGDNL
jgi:hypothetical protein